MKAVSISRANDMPSKRLKMSHDNSEKAKSMHWTGKKQIADAFKIGGYQTISSP